MPNELPEPITREEKYLAKAAGVDVDIPTPITREEKYLKAIAEGGGGGGFTPTEAQLTAMNSGIDSEKVAQIETNKNNISMQQDSVAEGGQGYAIINGQRLYMSDTVPTGTIPVGSALISNSKVWEYKNSTSANPTVLSDGTAISDYTIKGNAEQNGTPTPSSPVDVVGVGVPDNSDYIIPVSSGGVTTNVPIGTVQTTRAIKKLVFTGDVNENWEEQYVGEDRHLFRISTNLEIIKTNEEKCTHFIYGATSSSTSTVTFDITSVGVLRFRPDNAVSVSLSDWITWLQQQNTNGTPLTVWIVLATAETTTLNEPLMGIGAYADSITATQSQVSIPTTAGENAITFGATVQPSEFDITAWV